MHHVLLAKNSAARMQYKPVQAIFKAVGVKKTKPQAREDAADGIWKKVKGNPCEDSPGQKRSQQVVSLDPQPLDFPFGSNYII